MDTYPRHGISRTQRRGTGDGRRKKARTRFHNGADKAVNLFAVGRGGEVHLLESWSPDRPRLGTRTHTCAADRGDLVCATIDVHNSLPRRRETALSAADAAQPVGHGQQQQRLEPVASLIPEARERC